ncbi:hypothetical protein FRB90_008768 [Tulasnella sp. 427]|nr:hypothetical protein FRB90_008768 [Tulasnella sp. 427]
MSDRISKLLVWCKENDITIDPRLKVVDSEEDTGITVVATEPILPQTSVVQIPKSSVLSRRTCRYAELINNAFEAQRSEFDEPNLWLSLVLLTELSQGSSSRWHGYLQSLPLSPVPLASFWLDVNPTADTDEDSKLARAWIRGTEVERLVQQEAVVPKLRRFHASVLDKVLKELNIAQLAPVSFERFTYVYTLVSSRAFHVDAYHGIAMVPIADAFNHIEENQVHFESDYHVCPTCGSFDQCAHDEQDSSSLSRSSNSWHKTPAEDDDDTCEIVTNSPVHPTSEVFNTYDSRASNAKLLAHYGFMLEANSNDVVSFDEAELSGWLDGLDGTPMDQLDVDEGLEEAEVFFEGSRWEINAEGVLSKRLFELLVMRNMWKVHRSGVSKWPAGDWFDWLKGTSRLLFSLFLSIVSALNESSSDEHDSSALDDDSPPESYAAALGICADVDHLCVQKLQRLGPEDVDWKADWGEILDVSAWDPSGRYDVKSKDYVRFQATPLTFTKARMAITHAMNEKNILVACRERWRDIGELVAARASLAE